MQALIRGLRSPPSSLIFILTAVLACAPPICADDPPVVHSVLFQGKVGGEQKTKTSDGITSVEMSYRDNGRGPDMVEQIKVGKDGIPTLYKVSGKSTFGAPINESFSLHGNTVEWNALSDKGTKVVAKPGVYVPNESSFEMIAVIARALIAQPSHALASLPGGDLRIERVVESTPFDEGDRHTAAECYAITGFSTQPSFIWLGSGVDHHFFSFIYPGSITVIEKGWEKKGEVLEVLQVKAEQEWLEKLAVNLSHRLPDPALFRNVSLYDSKNAVMTGPADVYVRHGKIAAIYPPGSPARELRTAIDGTGKFLLPGLFDMHGHEDTWSCILQIAAGVTTSRDMGNDNANLASIIARIERGSVLGPRIVPCGFIEGESPFSARLGRVVKNLDGAKEAVDWYAQRGFQQIKIYNSFHPAWVKETAAYAHERGMRVSGHVPAFMTATEAVNAGYDEIQHINQVMLGFFVGPKDDTRTLSRFYLITQNAYKLDLDSPQVSALIALLQQHGTAVDTTLATFEGLFTQRQGEMNPSYEAVASHVPIALSRSWRTNSMDVTDENAATCQASWAKVIDFVGRMYRAGIPLEAGTDAIAGFTLQRELELYVKAGLTPAQALQIATWNGARFTRTLAERGSIEVGKTADLLLLPEDPTKNVDALRRINLVMKGDMIYYPAEIYEAIGVKRFVDPAKPEIVAMAAAR